MASNGDPLPAKPSPPVTANDSTSDTRRLSETIGAGHLDVLIGKHLDDESEKAALESTPTDDELLSTALSRLQKGSLAYSTPEKMRTGETARVTASIGSSQVAPEALAKSVPQGIGQTVATASTPISTKMRMSLKSSDFTITALSSDEQLVGGGTPTTWSWDVTPLHSGKARLHLAAVVELRNISRDFTTVDREIAVQVDPLDAVSKFINGNWQWVLSTIGAGILAMWGFFKKTAKKRTLHSKRRKGR